MSVCTFLHVSVISRRVQGFKYNGMYTTNTLLSYVQYQNVKITECIKTVLIQYNNTDIMATIKLIR
jgi:hypothetical protein